MNGIAIRGSIISFKKDPFLYSMKDCLQYIDDGIVVVQDGYVSQLGEATYILPQLDDIPIADYTGRYIMAGFIDCHVHFPQTEMMGAYGKELLDWLNQYTFRVEQKFSAYEYAIGIARTFLREQLRNGVTSSAVFGTVFPASVDALFTAAEEYGLRLMGGKVCMDRNAPQQLLDTAQRAYDESKSLINRWHGKGRLEYIITPRFIPTSTEAQLEMLGALAKEYPTMLIQSHISENKEEVQWVEELCPHALDYTDAYDHYGLVRPRSIYGHGIYLTERERVRFYESGASLAHCPTSNFFLGSGCLHVNDVKSRKRPVRLGLASDIGAGTSLSMLQTMNEAYKAAQMNGSPYTSLHAFYLATRGSAEALGIDEKIGSIEIGREADLIILNPRATDLMAFRMEYVKSLEEALFVLMTLGDDRAVEATYVSGIKVSLH